MRTYLALSKAGGLRKPALTGGKHVGGSVNIRKVGLKWPMSEYSSLLHLLNRKEIIALLASIAWALLVSEHIRTDIFGSGDGGEAEALIAFSVWCLFLWWLSKRIGAGWSFMWFAFALVSFAPFADVIHTHFGGVLGLRG